MSEEIKNQEATPSTEYEFNSYSAYNISDEYLDEETRELLFNQDDYNELSSELNKIKKRDM